MTHDELVLAIGERFSRKEATRIIERIRPSIRLVASKATHPGDALASRIGGLPALPADFVWPECDVSEKLKKEAKKWQNRYEARPSQDLLNMVDSTKKRLADPFSIQSFIAQINLAEVPAEGLGLPRTGMLSFFYNMIDQPWGFDPADAGNAVIAYFPDVSTLTLRDLPENLPEECRLPERSLAMRLEATIPTGIDGELRRCGDDRYDELFKNTSGGGLESEHRLLGNPNEVQNSMELECQLVSNGIYCGDSEGYKSSKARALAAGAEDWRLLLQVDTDDNMEGWMWGDCGRIYYWIRQQDLAARDFSKTWCVLQCS